MADTATRATLANASALLDSGERRVPALVESAVTYLEEMGLWSLLSRNVEAKSCRDAAQKRYRLGMRGVPVHDELKSFLGAYRDEKGGQRYVLAHCRGHQEIDMGRLRTVLGAVSNVERLNAEEIGQFHMNYGTVNPFTIPEELRERVVQVFDTCLAEEWGVPGTIMTNAGSLTWSIEFHCGQLIQLLEPEGCILGSIVEDALRGHAPNTRSVGIITGNSPDAGISLWRRINRRIRERMQDEFKGDMSLPRVVVHSMPEMGLSMELDRRDDRVWACVSDAVSGLCAQGVDYLTLACNTTQYFAPQIRELCEPQGVRFITMAEVVLDWARRCEVKELALVAIPPVADLGPWSAYRVLAQHVQIEPIQEATLARILELGYQVKREGVRESGLQRLRSIVTREVRSKYVLIALTELSNLLEAQRRPGRSGRVLVDALGLYAERVADLCLAGIEPLCADGKPRGASER